MLAELKTKSKWSKAKSSSHRQVQLYINEKVRKVRSRVTNRLTDICRNDTKLNNGNKWCRSMKMVQRGYTTTFSNHAVLNISTYSIRKNCTEQQRTKLILSIYCVSMVLWLNTANVLPVCRIWGIWHRSEFADLGICSKKHHPRWWLRPPLLRLRKSSELTAHFLFLPSSCRRNVARFRGLNSEKDF